MNWDLIPLYKSENELEKDISNIINIAKSFEKRFQRKVKELSENQFLEALETYENILESVAKVMTYSYLIFATDSSKGAFLAKYQKISTEIEEKLLFFTLEFNKIKSDKQNSIIKKSEKYSYFLKLLKDEKKHQLSLKEEKILLKKSLTSAEAFSRLFDEHLSRMKFKFEGKELNEEELLTLLYNKDRDVRKKASESLSRGLKESLHLLSYIFNMVKEDSKIEASIRKYKQVEDIRHSDNRIPKKSVDALINTVNSNFDISIEYYKLKSEILGFKLMDYDRYAPINFVESSYDFDESKNIVLDSFNSFNPKFYEIAKLAFDEKWIDAFPKDKKRGGAFSHSSTTKTHPYVMLNHTNKRKDLFTMAHELGHAIHQYLSRDVGYLNSDTPLTTAETASVFAEMILFDKIKDTLSKDEKIALYAGKLEDIFATLFRQIIFTNFERRVYSFDGELKVDDFNSFWYEENRKMFGKSLTLSENYKMWWSYIPHFIHSPFYCYAYSYGQLLVLALYGLYKSGFPNFEEIYLKFLSSGGSKSPKELIGEFGFDIESSDFWEIGIGEVKRILKEFKEVLNG